MNGQQIKVLLVEDHPLYRIGLRMALSYSESDIVVIDEADCVQSAEKSLQQHVSEIDVILLDYFLPDGTGKDVVRMAKQYCPQAKILIISADTSNPEIMNLINEGINGFISKDITPKELSLVIASVYQGHNYFDKVIIEQQEEWMREQEKEESLSPREIDIIRLCAKGLTAKQIAEQLNISPRTVEKHKDRIFSRLCFNSTVELVNYAIRKGLV
ncbi:MAG: response regulator transcription factor [Bacteroidales bacterium]|nr:response regulator transcription factor [Bacteroidales bacterium]